MKIRIRQKADKYYVERKVLFFWIAWDYFFSEGSAYQFYQQIKEKRGRPFILKEEEICQINPLLKKKKII